MRKIALLGRCTTRRWRIFVWCDRATRCVGVALIEPAVRAVAAEAEPGPADSERGMVRARAARPARAA
jgi:hypothetical protein